MVKADCFAYSNKQAIKGNKIQQVEGCRCLNELYCKSVKCNFYRNDIHRSDIERDIRCYSDEKSK